MFLFLHTISHFHLTPSQLSHRVFAATNHLTAYWKRIHHFCAYKQQRQQHLEPPSSQPLWNTSLEINDGISIMQGISGDLACQINVVQFKRFKRQTFSPLQLKGVYLIKHATHAMMLNVFERTDYSREGQ